MCYHSDLSHYVSDCTVAIDCSKGYNFLIFNHNSIKIHSNTLTQFHKATLFFDNLALVMPGYIQYLLTVEAYGNICVWGLETGEKARLRRAFSHVSHRIHIFTRGIARYKMKCRHKLWWGVWGPHKALSRSRAEAWWGVRGGQ